MISLIVALPRDGHFGPGVYAGLIAPFLLPSYLVWTATIAGRRATSSRLTRV